MALFLMGVWVLVFHVGRFISGVLDERALGGFESPVVQIVRSDVRA